MQCYLIAMAVLAIFALYFILRTKNSAGRKTGLSLKITPMVTGGRRYQELFEHSSDAIFVVKVWRGKEFHFESLNPVAMEVFDPTNEWYEGCLLDDVIKHAVDHERKHPLQNLSNHLAETVKTRSTIKYQDSLRVIDSDSECKIYDIDLIPMVDDGGLSHILCFARDITAQKLYEMELLKRAELENRFSCFAAIAPGFFYSYRHGTDGSNTMPFASKKITEFFGLSSESVAQSIAPLNMRIHLDDMPGVIEATARSAAALSAMKVEFRVEHREKGELWIESHAVPIEEADGSIVWHGFMHDITERKNIEFLLLRQKESFRTLAENCPDPIFRYAPDGRRLYVNKSVLEMSGKVAETLLLQTPEDMQLLAPSEASKLMSSIFRAVKTGEAVENEVTYVDRNGTVLTFANRYAPEFGSNGEVESVLCISHSVTERKRLEESQRYSHQNLVKAQRIGQMGSWVLDLGSGSLTWSDEIFRILEIDPSVFDASSEEFLIKIHPDDREMVKRTYTESREDQIPFRIDYRLKFPDGRVKYVQECCETHYDAECKPDHVLGTVQDISSLKIVEQQLKDVQDKLRELVISREQIREDERKRIAWEMHEELGQQLSAIKMHIFGMRTQLPKDIPLLNENVRMIVHLVDESIKSVHEIVSDLRPTVMMHGPVAALEWLVAEFNKHPTLKCRLKVHEQSETLISEELTTLIFRVAQESLEDASRHAGVTCVLVTFSSDQHMRRLTVQHDGKGDAIDITGETSLVFMGMQQRIEAFGGELRISSTPEQGGLIEAIIPAKRFVTG
jgi:PAS domain S-box-containing protein